MTTPTIIREVRLRSASVPARAEERVKAIRVQTPTGRGGLYLSIDERAVALGPMRRDAGVAHVIRAGRRIEDPAEIRAPFTRALTDEGHLGRFRRAQTDLSVYAITGCGNLGLNPGVLAQLPPREELLGTQGPSGPFVTVAANGRAHAGLPRAGESYRFALSGPSLVQAGRAAPPAIDTIADPRHALSFPYAALGKVQVDFGLASLLKDRAELQRAEAGEPVRIDLKEELRLVGEPPISLEAATAAVAAALLAKGYAESNSQSRRGQFLCRGGILQMRFLEGLYPHQALCVDSEGHPFVVLLPGRSNRAGTTLSWLAADLAEAGIQEAILLDNGGDVGLWLESERRFLIQPAEADRAKDWPLTAALIHAIPIDDAD